MSTSKNFGSSTRRDNASKRVRFHFTDTEENLTEEEVRDIERKFYTAPDTYRRNLGTYVSDHE